MTLSGNVMDYIKCTPVCVYSIKKESATKYHQLKTLRPVDNQTEAFFSTDLIRDAEYRREQTLCHSVRKSKVLQIQPSDES